MGCCVVGVVAGFWGWRWVSTIGSGFGVHRGGGKVVGFGVDDRIWISGFVVGLMWVCCGFDDDDAGDCVGEQRADGGCGCGCGCSKILEISRWRRDGFNLFRFVFRFYFYFLVMVVFEIWIFWFDWDGFGLILWDGFDLVYFIGFNGCLNDFLEFLGR